ncbi:g13527 [Coccomyxa viridis]|uniref:G13527 protein n=1 Tax=Coccomyxa viridis TaxID=1274662 RepID=A0ABP1GFJ8_9CHLO
MPGRATNQGVFRKTLSRQTFGNVSRRKRGRGRNQERSLRKEGRLSRWPSQKGGLKAAVFLHLELPRQVVSAIVQDAWDVSAVWR